MNVTVEATEVQKHYPFADNLFDFTINREERTNDLTLVQRIEIDPASMSKQQEPRPGVIRIYFMPEATNLARERIRNALAEAIPGEMGGSIGDAWFSFTPENGIITHETVQETLRILFENDAIVLHDVSAASHMLGVPMTGYTGDRSRDLTGLYDPKKPRLDSAVAEIAGALSQRYL